MARPIWKGHLSFGLVTIPVQLVSAEAPEEDLEFHMIDRRDQSRIQYKRVNASTNREVPWRETVKAFELDNGDLVVLTPDDFKRAAPKATRSIEIVGFVQLEDIAPKYYVRPYILEPQEGGEKVYALLRDALRQTGMVGIAQLVLHTRQHLCAILVDGPFLSLITLRFDAELRSPKDFRGIAAAATHVKGTKAELDAAATLIKGMAVDWDPTQYRDEYQAVLRKWINQRAKLGPGKRPPPVEEEELEPAQGSYSIVELLKQSVEQTRRADRSTRAPSRAIVRRSTSRRAG